MCHLSKAPLSARAHGLSDHVARAAGAFDAVVCEHWEKGGAGTVALVKAVQKACAEPPQFRFLYELDLPIKAKIEKIAVEMYRADGVDYLPEAEAAIEKYTALGFDKLPICMAKTQYSFSHDAKRKGAPTGFRLPIRCALRLPRLALTREARTRCDAAAVGVQGPAGVCRRGVPVSARGLDDDDARPAHAAVLLRHRCRSGDGHGGGAVVGRPGCCGWRSWGARLRRNEAGRDAAASWEAGPSLLSGCVQG